MSFIAILRTVMGTPELSTACDLDNHPEKESEVHFGCNTTAVDQRRERSAKAVVSHNRLQVAEFGRGNCP